MDKGAECYRRYLDGCDAALEEIIREYRDGLILFLCRYVDDFGTAEELAEDTFFKLCVKKPRFRADFSFRTYLYTIARNAALNYIKRQNRIPESPIDELSETLTDRRQLESAYLQKEEKTVLYNALAKINRLYSQVLFLRYFEELRCDEIAAVIKKSRRQTENLLYQAKKSLREQLEREGFSYENL